MPETNYYTLLAIPRSASNADIKTRYRKLSLKYHPDSGGSTEQMILLNKAYSVLSSPLLRREYDQKHPPVSQTYARTQPGAAGFDFVRTPNPQTARQAEPTSRTRHDDSVWDYAPSPESRKKPRGRVWPWFAVSVIVVGFLGYQLISVFQTSSEPSSGVATTTTPVNTDLSTTTPAVTDTSTNDTAVGTALASTSTADASTTTAASTTPTTTTTSNSSPPHYNKHHYIKYDDSF